MEKKKYILVEDVLNIHDPNRVWLYIPGFNGYEISNDGYIRSIKHWRKYPFGILIQPRSNKKDTEPIYNITNDNNERVNISYSEIYRLAHSVTNITPGYPRKTIETNVGSRNQKCTIKRPPKQVDNTVHSVRFTIIK